ncbi:MAG TPA: farnesyl diphosphate synthase [Candidatus Angelobacter sp.]|jgi:geranylgeranyl diphosphate synthase type II|nr:farnesyl diphosphate synthase [Candidatus Angelobacter sp.]
MKVPDFFESDLKVIDAELEKLMPPEDTPPASIHRAMRYSVFAGGKRLRPILCYEASRLYTLNPEPVVPVACAVEFIHTYSLIHDDLPALDNDDLRRGKQTCHKVFGEAIAILAGDALLTLAFKTLAEAPLDTAMRRVNVLAEIANAAGTVKGMVGGQVADLEAEGKQVTPEALEYIHRSKTAALIRGAVTAGGIAGGAGDAHIERLRRFGEQIGWAFQIVDDILDVEESSAALGKTAGKDEAQKKATYPALYGVEKSREIADDLSKKALKELDCYGERAGRLRALSQFLVARRT